MATIGDGKPKQRIYSAAEIDSCLRFVKLSSSEVQWWPCLVFSNMLELQCITEQLQLWTTLTERRELTLMYMRHLPGSATCRVALLMGQPPPPQAILKFDIPTNPDEDALILEPFYDNVLQFGMLYSENEQYLHAVQQTLPLLQHVTDSLQRNKEQDSTAASMGLAIETKPPSNTTAVKENVRIPDISFKDSENSVPLKNATKIPAKISKPQVEIANASSATASTRRNSPRHPPTVSASSTSGPKTTENTRPPSSRSIPSVPPSANPKKDAVRPSTVKPTPSVPPSVNTKKDAVRPSTGKPTPSVPLKQCEVVEIPSFEEVKPALIKGGYKFTTKSFCRPPMVIPGEDTMSTPRFNSIAALRRDLCVYGVNCQCGQTTMDESAACACWTADEKWYIKLWVRYDVIRGDSALPTLGTPVPILSPHRAQQYLIRLRYYSRQLSSSLATTDQVHDLFRYLSRYGLPVKNSGSEDATCDYSQLTPLERLSLEYFISSSHYCVNTFTVIPRSTEERVPFWSMAEDDSPLSSSAVRPKRSASMRMSLAPNPEASVTKRPKVTRDESTSSTIVSVESEVSNVAESIANAKKKRVVSSSDKVETTSSKKQSKRMSFDSPIASTNRIVEDLTQEDSVQKQRVSLSPMFSSIRNQEPPPIPAFDGSDYENLCSCLEALRTAHQSNTPTISFTNSTNRSKFARNLQLVSDFLQAIVSPRAKRGASSKSSAALYVCGAPGLGKSSGVRWCCDMASKAAPVEAKVCHVNAAHLTSQSNPMRFLLDEMGKSLGIKAKQPKESAILKMLRTAGNNVVEDSASKAVVMILVVDEIDSLVTGNGKSTTSKECLRTLLEWANSPTLRMGLIGISNCMNDEKRSDIQELGKFTDTVIFSPYSEQELKQILFARVGTSVIASNVLDYVAKKVAASSGDARKALELAANAVQHRLDQLTSSEGKNSRKTSDGPIVKMPNVVQANKDETINLKERIAGQPVVGKVILCVLTSYAQAGGAVDTTIGELKQCVSECMRQTGMEDEMVQMDDFLVLLETLVDSGLLRASSNAAIKADGNGLNLSRRMLSDVHRQPIRLGIQLEDIEKVLESDLQQSFYQNIRERAKHRRRNE